MKKVNNSVNYYRLWLIIYEKCVIIDIFYLVTFSYQYCMYKWQALTPLSLDLYKPVQENETVLKVFTWIDT